ncbi:MAG: hypothetical protein ABI323_07400 [Solirubrobacteraceae bacterium]
MATNYHFMKALADERVASLRNAAVARPERSTFGARRSSRSRRRRAYRSYILRPRGVTR